MNQAVGTKSLGRAGQSGRKGGRGGLFEFLFQQDWDVTLTETGEVHLLQAAKRRDTTTVGARKF